MSQNYQILWQDEAAMVVNKPAGMACLPLAGSTLKNIAENLSEAFPELKSVSDFGLCHRLDNDTSGCLLLAKSEATYQFYRKAFQEQKVRKFYQALVFGKTLQQESISWPIAHHPRKNHKMIACMTEARAEVHKARPALTHFQALEYFAETTLLELEIVTGMRHQIRVHLAFLGHPIIGDKLYQKPQEREQDRFGLARLFLHASKLSFPSFKAGSLLSVEAKLPKELSDILAVLRAR